MRSKSKVSLVITFIVLMVMLVTSCSADDVNLNASSSVSYTFDVESDKRIEVKCDTLGGYMFLQADGNMYVRDKNDNSISGFFIKPDIFEQYLQDETLEQAAKDNGDIYYYAVDSVGTVVMLEKVTDDNLGVIFYTEDNADFDNAISLFNRLTFTEK
ncbi:MAG: hypothetical protein IJ593_03370 [Lachnospiraceae bacterium]|nr:hypothetical protein [Lachnospiraceae bacterium]